MATRNRRTLLTAVAIALSMLAIAVPLSSVPGRASHNQVECESRSTHVKAATSPDTYFITTIAQVPPHILEPLLSTTVTVGGGQPSCIVAHFSTVARVIEAPARGVHCAPREHVKSRLRTGNKASAWSEVAEVLIPNARTSAERRLMVAVGVSRLRTNARSPARWMRPHTQTVVSLSRAARGNASA